MCYNREKLFKFFIFAFLAVAICCQVQATLLVDISANSGTPLQSGYLEFYAGAEQTSPKSFNYSSDLGLNGTLTVGISGNTHYRDYPAIISSNPYYSMTNLLSDNALRNVDGTMVLTLSNLIDGTYSITTYHHDTSTAGIFDLRLTDANMTNQTLFSNVSVEEGTNPSKLNTLTFNFEVEDNSSVMIYMQRKVGSSGGNHLALNGFNLDIETPAVPEPTTLILFLGCIGFFSIIRRKDRR